MTQKKQVEEHQLSLFRGLIPDFPEGSVISTEVPDFLIEGQNSVVGIEITSIHRGNQPKFSKLQAVESMRHRVVQQAGKSYLAMGGPAIRCTVHMNGPLIRQAEMGPLSHAIADFALRNLPGPESSVELDDFSCLPLLASQLSAVSIYRTDILTETFFSAPGATWVPPLTRSDVASMLAQKEARYPAYRARCDEAWLVMVANYGTMSTWFDFPKDLGQLSVPTTFDRVYLLDGFGRKAHGLAPRP